GQEEEEGTEPISPPQDTEGGKAEIQAQGQQLSSQNAEVEAGVTAPTVEAPTAGGGGGDDQVEVSAELQQSISEAQSDAKEASTQAEAEANAFKAEISDRRDKFDAEQSALAHEQVKSMSAADKRATLVEMGMDEKSVKKMKDAELDGIITGRIETEQRKTKILGMDPEQLAALSPAAKAQFLVDLGIDKKDIDKIGPDKAARAFDDVMRVAHVPGQHKVKIKVKGGLLGKSWELSVKVDAEGNPDIEAKKKGGFLSKLWGWVKLALPIIALVLAPVTAGASLIILAVYQTVTAIAAGDWLGAIIGAAGAMVGLGAISAIGKTASGAATAFGKIADVAGKVQKVAQAAQASMAAAKAKNAGGLLAALSAGAGAFAKFADNQAGKFAKTMRSWSDKLDRWSKVITGAQNVAKGIKTGNVGVALGGAFDAVAAGFSKKDKDGNETSTKTQNFEKYARMAKFAAAGQNAAKSDPPAFDQIVDSALGIAGELDLLKKGGDAAKITSNATRLGVAIASKNPQAITAAALSLAESIQTAKVPDDESDGQPGGSPEEKKKAIMDAYARANRVVNVASQAIKAAAKKPRPDYASALDASAQLIAEFTEDKRLDAAAKVTATMDAWTKAIGSKNEEAILKAGLAFGESIRDLRTSIHEHKEKAKADAQAKLAPGESMPAEDAGEVADADLGPPELLPSRSLDFGLVGLAPALDPESPMAQSAPLDSKAHTPDANYTVVQGDTLGGIAQRFQTPVATLHALNPQLAGDMIYRDQRLNVPNADVPLRAGTSTSYTWQIDPRYVAEADRRTEAQAKRKVAMATARTVFDSTKAQIKTWRDTYQTWYGPGLGAAFHGALLDLERTMEPLGRHIDDPGIGTNVIERETELVKQASFDVAAFFDRQNSGRTAAYDVMYKAAEITKKGASVVLAVFDRSGFIKAGYESAIAGIEAHQAGASPGMSLFRGAVQGALEKFSLIKDPNGSAVVTKAINEAYKLMGETLSDILVFVDRNPKPTPQQQRDFWRQKAQNVVFTAAFGPMKGKVSELDTRLTDVDLPSLEHGAKSLLVELGDVVVKAMAEEDKNKKKKD
ncbi:MAG TPA: LysM peptidoglycan-binding domain-containing protein, partial [Kofleriaceae bacterium]